MLVRLTGYTESQVQTNYSFISIGRVDFCSTKKMLIARQIDNEVIFKSMNLEFHSVLREIAK